MKKIFVCLILTWMLGAGIEACAQASDSYMQKIESLVTSMRDHPGKEKEWNAAVSALAQPGNPMVALLDNLAPDNADAEWHKGAQADPMHLNGAITRAFDSRKGEIKSKGDYYNSLARGINYSMIEKTIAGNSQIAYTLVGHSGAQEFAIIPYNGADSDIEVSISVDDVVIEPYRVEKSKITRFKIDALKKDSKIKISLANSGKKPQAVVIINHNTKK